MEARRSCGRFAALRQPAPRQHGQLRLVNPDGLATAQPQSARRAHARRGEAGASSQCSETKSCTAAHARALARQARRAAKRPRPARSWRPAGRTEHCSFEVCAGVRTQLLRNGAFLRCNFPQGGPFLGNQGHGRICGSYNPHVNRRKRSKEETKAPAASTAQPHARGNHEGGGLQLREV